MWGKRSQWLDYSGQIDGSTVGIAVLDHPAIRGRRLTGTRAAYGLLAANIFGVHDFEADKSRDGSLTIRPGQPLRFRYRVVIHPGNAGQAGIGDIFTEYSNLK